MPRCALALTLLAIGLTALPASGQPTPPYFADVTDEVGLTGIQAFRVSVGDLDGDGFPDLFIHLEPTHASSDVLDKQLVYMNRPGAVPGERVFVDATSSSGVRANREGTGDGRHSDAAIFADVDNDGDLDVFTSVYLHRNYTLDLGSNEVLLNEGDGTFALSPTSTFHTQPNWNTPAANFLDYDNDGRIDVFIGTWYNPDSTLNVDRLYQGDGAGAFADVTSAAGLDTWTTCIYGIASFDWDGDGDVDLFAPPYSHTVFNSIPLHWRNNGDGTFTRVESSTNYDDFRGTASFVASFGTMPWDYDNDGDFDFLEILTHGKEITGPCSTFGNVHSTIARNDEGTFVWRCEDILDRGNEDTDTTHHGDHFASWFDYDGDMLADFVITESGYDNPGIYLFRQATDNTFSPDTIGSGLDEINTNGWSPGYATPMDFDRDGDEDLIVTIGGSVGIKLYRNEVGTDKGWLAIDLEGVGGPGFANKSAIGARVEVSAGGVTQTQYVQGGNGHEGPMRPFTLHFGLGGNAQADLVRVTWPNASGSVQELTNVAANQFLKIVESCDFAADPANLMLDKSPSDVLMSWDDPADPELTWNVYRDPSPDPSAWQDAHESGVTDEDGATPGIQHADEGAASDGATWFYLVTANNVCGETPLR